MSDAIKQIIEQVEEINLKEFIEKHYNAKFVNNQCCCILDDHNDKTPSFTYHPDSNRVTCFGCKELEGANIINVVAAKEKIEPRGEGFIRILKDICNKEGIKFPENNKPLNQNAAQLIKHKTNCAVLYRDNLWNNKNSYGFNYLIDRGLTEQTIRTFSLGLTSENESRYGKGGISNRISIPILNSKGDGVIATSFRRLVGSESERKYLHDATDEVFNKKEVFYGYSHAIKDIREKKHVYIVEGYFDMISLYQSGMKNTLACMSNQMTIEQVTLLSKIAPNVTIILDQDSAGDKGYRNMLPEMLKLGLNVRVISNLGFMGKDANELCNKLEWDSNKIQAFINSKATDGVQFMLSSILDIYDDKMIQLRYNALSASDSVLRCVVDPIKKRNYEDFINRRLR